MQIPNDTGHPYRLNKFVKRPLVKASGVYVIRCLSNDRVYIGSTVNISKRWNVHIHGLRNNNHGNSKLLRAWRKYGETAFKFEILELCAVVKLVTRENYWIRRLKAFGPEGMNLTPKAGSTLGRRFSLIQRNKLKVSANRPDLLRWRSRKARQMRKQGLLGSHLISVEGRKRISEVTSKAFKRYHRQGRIQRDAKGRIVGFK